MAFRALFCGPLFLLCARRQDGQVKPWVKGVGMALFYVLAAVALIWVLSVLVNEL